MPSKSAQLPRLPRLPFYAGSWAILSQELRAGRPRLEVVHAVLCAEPALAVRVLVYANRNRGVPVAHLAAAIALLSPEALRASLQGRWGLPYASIGQEAASLLRWRQRSMAVAGLARILAREVGASQSLAYTAGLLHAVAAVRVAGEGATVVVTAQAPAQPDPSASMGAPATAQWLRDWGLPDLLTQPIEAMHAPLGAFPFTPLAAILHLAEWRMATEHHEKREQLRERTYPADVALAVGLDMDHVLQQDPVQWPQGD